MKKKIEDLTVEEMKKICCNHKNCDDSCPLNFSHSVRCALVYKESAQEYEKFDKEKEVEIDE